MMRRFIATLLLFSTFSFVNAESNVKDIGDYIVFYSALNSDFIQPEVAKQYGLARSRTLGLVNVTVMDKKLEKATVANISGSATNLLGQRKTLAFKEIREADALYYIAQFKFNNNERYQFRLEIRTPGSDNSKPVNFVHTMYESK